MNLKKAFTINFIVSLIVVPIIVLGTLYYIYNNVALWELEPVEQELGATVTTISTATKFNAFPAIYNADLNSLNDNKIENSTTTLPLITTLANLSTVGTITSGTWNGTAIAVSKGGTGTTSPQQYHVMLGDGSSGLATVLGLGESGQFLTSNGAGAYPSWQSSTVNLNQSYAWTYPHSWASSTDFNGISTFSATTTLADITIGHNVAALTASTTITGATTPQPVYIATSTSVNAGGVLLAGAGANSTLEFFGFAITSASAGETVYVQTDGIVAGFSGLTKGAKYYVQNTAGTIGTSLGDSEVLVGIAISETEILMQRGKSEFIGGATGSGDGTATIAMPKEARMAIIKVKVDSSNMSSIAELTIIRNTKTTAEFRDGLTTGGGGGHQGASLALSGDTITATEQDTTIEVTNITMTAYFYR